LCPRSHIELSNRFFSIYSEPIKMANRSERPSPRWSFTEGGSRQSTGLQVAEQLSAPERAEAHASRPSSFVLRLSSPPQRHSNTPRCNHLSAFASQLAHTHDRIGAMSIRQKFFPPLLSRKAASLKVCSPEPEVSFKPPAVYRVAGSPFSSVGSQQPVPGWILIREGVDAPVSWVLPSRLTKI